MRRLFDSAIGHDLRLCPTCRRPFVAPREILASHEDGNHVVELSCANCGWWAIQLHGGLRLSALDEALDRDSAQIEAAAEAPWPRKSGAMTSWASASADPTGSQVSEFEPIPWAGRRPILRPRAGS